MDYNFLLAYLTELGSGDWAKFRQALEFLSGEDEDLYPSVRARCLSILGHIEFAFYDDMRWAACPPTLAWLPCKDKLTAVLCGGRSQRLVEAVREQATNLNLQIEITQQNYGPDAIFVSAQARNIIGELAHSANLAVEQNPAGRIAQCLPSLDNYVQLCLEAPEPSGYKIKTFDTDLLKWVNVSGTTGEGLYWYEYYKPEYRLKVEGSCLRTTREIGIYLLLKHKCRNVLCYDCDTQELSVPVRAPLPALFAKAAVLSSGLLPNCQNITGLPTYIYREVPASIAQVISLRLCQTIEVRR